MEHITLNLNEKKIPEKYGKELFDRITNLPKEVRPDAKESAGIYIYIGKPGSRNRTIVSIQKPSEDARISAIANATRSEILGYATSQNNEDPDKMRFRGSITVSLYGKVQVSVAGLEHNENVAIAVIIASKRLVIHVQKVIKDIEINSGKLPKCFYDKEHYLYKLLGSYF